MFKKQILTSVLIGITAVSCGGSGGASGESSIFALPEVNKGPVVLSINDLEVHQGFIDLLIELNPRIKPQLDNPLTRRKILNSLVDQQLLFDEAQKRGLDSKTDIQAKILLNRHVVIANALIETELDAAMTKAYEERKSTEFSKIDISLVAALFNPNDEKAKPTDDQKAAALAKIKSMHDKLKSGTEFETVAKDLSDDKLTNKKGGMAGQISVDDKRLARLGLKPVTEAAFKLKKNQFSDPIETPKGYYIVKVNSDLQQVPYEEAKRVLQFEMQNTIKKDLVDNLRKTAKIEFASNSDQGVTSKTPKVDANLQVDSTAKSNLKAKVNIGAPVPKNEDTQKKPDHQH